MGAILASLLGLGLGTAQITPWPWAAWIATGILRNIFSTGSQQGIDLPKLGMPCSPLSHLKLKDGVEMQLHKHGSPILITLFPRLTGTAGSPRLV